VIRVPAKNRDNPAIIIGTIDIIQPAIRTVMPADTVNAAIVFVKVTFMLFDLLKQIK